MHEVQAPMGPLYVVITPVRDEVDCIQRTIDSMNSQTIRPQRWIVVDDGSSDGTGEILDSVAKESSWITVVHRADRGCRAAGSGVIDAFYAGYGVLHGEPWEFVVKLDGDLSFDPEYFEKCFEAFAKDPSLGIGGGTVCTPTSGARQVDSTGDPPFHVRGATKIYRRECWNSISPLPRAPGWDTIDEVKANQLGWSTRTFSDLDVIQHKPTGGADGRWRNWFKNGFANYMTGYHPIFMLAKCVKRAFGTPLLVQSAALWAGFCSGYIHRTPRAADSEAIRYLRGQQVRRLLMRRSIYGG